MREHQHTMPVAKAPTISQIAAKAGVSRSTVSRVFSRPDEISQETIERVRAIADSIGYVPNHAARALSTGRHRNIAVMVPDVANPFFPPLIAAAQSEADRHDYCIFLGSSSESATREEELVRRLGGQLAGMVLVSSRMSEKKIRQLAERPLVLVNRDITGIPRVLIDSTDGARQAVEHLAELGHNELVYLSGPSNSWSNTKRRNAVRRTAAAKNIRFSAISSQKPTFEAGYESVDAILESGTRAVIAFDDLLAQGVLAGLAARRIAVPEQISVIGCDDVLGATTFPPLTTVSNRSEDAGRVACRLLMEMLENNMSPDVRYVMDTHLVIRASTG